MSNNTDAPGFYGWKLVAAAFAIYLVNTALPYYGGSVLNVYMAQELGFSRSALGSGLSILLLAVGLSSPLVGILVNKLGVRLTLGVGGATLTLGCMAMATVVSSELHYYVFFGVLIGLGFSFGGIIPVQSVVTYWFKRRKPLAMSIVLCASGIGSVIAIPVLNGVVAEFDGNWRIGWYVAAGCCLVSAVIALLWVRNKPEDLGQQPDGDAIAITPDAAAKSTAASLVYHTDYPWSVAEAIRTRASWLIVYSTCTLTMVFNMCIAHGVVHLQDQGLSTAVAASSVGLLVMSSVVGRLATGTLGARIEPRLTWCGGMLLLAIGLQVLSFATVAWHLYLYAFAVGAGFGISYVSFATILGNYFGNVAFAPLLGILTTITCIVGALSPILAGAAYDQLGDYSLPFTVLLALNLLGFASIPFARPPQPPSATSTGA